MRVRERVTEGVRGEGGGGGEEWRRRERRRRSGRRRKRRRRRRGEGEGDRRRRGVEEAREEALEEEGRILKRSLPCVWVLRSRQNDILMQGGREGRKEGYQRREERGGWKEGRI